MDTQTLQVGQTVVYTDTNGKVKPAIVLGTPDSVVEGTQVPTLAEGQAHLRVLGYTRTYTKFSVPSLALVEAMKAQGNTDFEGGGFFVV